MNLTGADLVFSTSNAFVPTVGQTFTIINNDEADAITGTFNGLSEGGTISNFLGSGLNAAISYRGGTGNDVVLTIRSLPSATVSGGGTVCLEQPLPNVSIVLTGTPPWSITYSNGISSTSIPVINVSPYVITEAGPGTYTVTAVSNSDGVGISMVGSAVVAVTPLPVVSITQSTLCTGLILNQNYYVVFFK